MNIRLAREKTLSLTWELIALNDRIWHTALCSKKNNRPLLTMFKENLHKPLILAVKFLRLIAYYAGEIWKHNSHHSFWICVLGKLGQGFEQRFWKVSFSWRSRVDSRLNRGNKAELSNFSRILWREFKIVTFGNFFKIQKDYHTNIISCHWSLQGNANNGETAYFLMDP